MSGESGGGGQTSRIWDGEYKIPWNNPEFSRRMLTEHPQMGVMWRSMQRTISFTLNGKPTRVTTDPDRMLLWVLRSDLGLTGTKFGCGEALCGACTVIVGEDAVRSCALPLKDVEGKQVTTIEGIGAEERLHPIQEAFLKRHAFQCGFCTPGMILNAYALLLRNPRPSHDQIIQAMDDNLCRCGSHVRVVEAITEASAAMRGGAR